MSPLASIPSPGSGELDLGSLTIHMYGLMLLAAILVATFVARRRWVARGGDADLVYRCAVWGVVAGIVGARLYHLATSWDEVPDEWWGPFAIWKGGLGVWGGIASGCLVGGLVARRAGADWRVLADCLAPGLLLAQGIGRLGNYWNQELFGKPTDLPWALEIDVGNALAAGFDASQTTFHPTFLYELIWDFLAAAVLVYVIEKRLRPRPPGIFAWYVLLYTFGRFWIELLRVDPAHGVGPFRLNNFVALAVFLLAAGWLLRARRSAYGGPPSPRPPKKPKKPPAPAKPPRKMAVPKGRVRP